MKGRLYDHARFRISGDRGLLVEYGEGVDLEVNEKVRKMAEIITASNIDGLESIVPAYRSLSITYDPLRTTLDALQRRLVELEDTLDQARVPASRTVVIPVCYGGEFGPDIQFVASYNHLTVDEVVTLHTQRSYHIFAVGFIPGFCYLGGLDERLHTPRLETPRAHVPSGSVGIAEAQTGVYPLDSPGGWRLIGRTPLKLFAPLRPVPFLYKAGDRIEFITISEDEYRKIARREAE